jgi:hypothetical protein
MLASMQSSMEIRLALVARFDISTGCTKMFSCQYRRIEKKNVTSLQSPNIIPAMKAREVQWAGRHVRDDKSYFRPT